MAVRHYQRGYRCSAGRLGKIPITWVVSPPGRPPRLSVAEEEVPPAGERPSTPRTGLAFSPEGSAKGLRAWRGVTGETARPDRASCRWRRCGGRSGTMGQMNRYGQMAMDHWRKWLPNQLAEIPDPEMYFSTLGLEVAQAIDELADRLAGPGSPE